MSSGWTRLALSLKPWFLKLPLLPKTWRLKMVWRWKVKISTSYICTRHTVYKWQKKSCDKIKGQKSDGLGCCTACGKNVFSKSHTITDVGSLGMGWSPEKHSWVPMWQAAQDVERRAFCRQEELETRFEAGSGMIEWKMERWKRCEGNLQISIYRMRKNQQKDATHSRKQFDLRQL